MQLGLLLAVGIGGFIGAVLRFSISNWVNTFSNSSFPFGTLSVNVLGSFVIGFLFLYFQQVNLSLYQKSLLITGLLGALTTFSTFSLDTVLLIQEELYIKAFSNIFLNVFFSIGATLLGMIIFKRIYV
ncbi:MAG: Putative fluoride ion transporter CrcB [uncultured Sulfurovum sp.]|uniref:Fluoride-specific ion channel FluC n=1 Tax=uncultured Sulfurovum sp. TaxID=269237 RepID=A0A6S6RUF2_9BACT|nr:MAG: Putative fluoride ion transporter CrcB [uncultured Sulfurovum sp.]